MSFFFFLFRNYILWRTFTIHNSLLLKNTKVIFIHVSFVSHFENFSFQFQERFINILAFFDFCLNFNVVSFVIPEIPLLREFNTFIFHFINLLYTFSNLRRLRTDICPSFFLDKIHTERYDSSFLLQLVSSSSSINP